MSADKYECCYLVLVKSVRARVVIVHSGHDSKFHASVNCVSCDTSVPCDGIK